MKKLIFRVLRLPFDLLCLSFDCLRVLGWVGTQFRWRLLAKGHPHATGPWCAGTHEAAGSDGRTIEICLSAGKYGNPFLFRWLCPWLLTSRRLDEGAGRICGRTEGGNRFFPLRYFCVTVLLALVWTFAAGAAYVGVTQLRRSMPGRPTPHDTRGRQPPGPRSRERQAAKVDKAEAEKFLRSARRLAAEGHPAEARLQYENAIRCDRFNVEAVTGLGDCALRLGQRTAAAQIFTRAAELDPANLVAHLRLADLKLESGDIPSATSHARQACDLASDDQEARLLLSRCYRADGKLEEALQEAQAALRLEPANPQALIALAAVEYGRKNWDEAERQYRKALSLTPDAVEAWMGLAAVSHARGNIPEGIRCLKTILETQPDNVAATAALIDMYVANNSLQAAIDLCRDFTARHREHAVFRGRLAELQTLSGDVNGAYTTAIGLQGDHPKYIPGYLIVANLFLKKGFPALAEDYCKKALGQDPGAVEARKLLARAYMSAGALENALKELDRLSKALPEDPEILLNRGSCYTFLGRNAEAEACFLAIAQKYPASPLADIQLAQVCVNRKDMAKAMDCYRKALEKSPDNLLALNNLAMLLLQHGHAVDEAFTLATRARNLFPNHPIAVDTLGWVHFYRQDYAEAVRLLASAQRALPRNPTIRYHLAAALLAKGDLDAAQRQAQTALSLSSTFEDVGNTKAVLEQIAARRQAKKTAQ